MSADVPVHAHELPSDRTAAVVPNEVIVRFEPTVAAKNVPSLLSEIRGMSLVEAANLSPRGSQLAVQGELRLLRTSASVEETIRELEADPRVRYAEPNYVLSTHVVPNDPQFGQLWGMHNTGQTGGTSDADIDAPEAWDISTGSSSVIVGIIDTGINYTHEDLAANVWSNPGEIAGNGIDDDGNGYVDDIHGINAITDTGDPMDDNGHGSHVSGTIGAVGNNGVGVAGVNWNVQLIGCKFLSSSGSGTTADAIKCFQYFNDLRAQRGQEVLLTSNSWGGGGYSQALRDAMEGLDQPGMPTILHVCAAGNSNVDTDASPHYPSSYTLDNILAVAATDHNDAYASFSNWGATSVDIAAPGVNILSTWIPGNSYNTISGTSMATPHVSGAAALLWSKDSTLSAAQVKQQIMAAGDSISGTKQTLTNARLNLREPCLPQPIADAGPSATICLGDTVVLGTPAQPDTTYLWSPGGETTAQISVMPGVTTTYTLTATTSCGSATDTVTVFVDDGTNPGLSEDFESGAPGWQTTGLWHLTSNGSCASPAYSSPVGAMYYGQDSTCNYDTGAANSGTLLSPTITGINTTSTLSFDYYRQVESYAGAYDATRVDVVGPSGLTTVWSRDSSDPSAAAWMASGPIDLSAFAGESIQLQFTFNTGDSVGNAFTGWMIDDVTVTGSSTCTGGNTPPNVLIASPPDGSQYVEGAAIDFTAVASDAEDGDLSSQVSWESDLDGSLGTGASVSAMLSVGTHVITAAVSDSEGLGASASISVTVNANTPPVVAVTAPADGTVIAVGTAITLSATATDSEDGDLSSSIAWSSDLDGSLGSGASLDVMLSEGMHTITASATDSHGATTSDTVSISVVANDPPSVSIGAPTDGSTFDEGSPVMLSGTATDVQDGDLSAGLSWSSSLDGALGTGASLSVVLSVGTHTITASVTDSLGASGSASIAVTVNPNTAPVVTITSPSDGATYEEGDTISFAGSALDAQDGDLTASLSWISSRDGIIGTGGAFDAVLSPGAHSITVVVYDSLGRAGTAGLSVTVNPNTAPVVVINSPADGSTFEEGDTVTLAGTATDLQDGDLTGALVWNSSVDGSLGTGGSLMVVLSPGTHTLSAAAVDSFGVTTTTSVSVTVNPNTAPVVSITAPADGSTYEESEVTAFAGTALDAQDGDLTPSLSWTSSVDGPLGSGGSFSAVLSPGTHTITASVADTRGLVGSDSITVTVHPNTAPVVTIVSPASGITRVEGNEIVFTATADDAQEGDLSAQITWTSSLDGVIGSGASFTTSTLSLGTHQITATVTDALGLSGSATRVVTIIYLAPPSDLNAKAKGWKKVELTWVNNATSPSYSVVRIERTTDPAAGWSMLTQRSPGTTAMTDYWIERGTTYYYRVRACTVYYGCSAPSNVDSVNIP